VIGRGSKGRIEQQAREESTIMRFFTEIQQQGAGDTRGTGMREKCLWSGVRS